MITSRHKYDCSKMLLLMLSSNNLQECAIFTGGRAILCGKREIKLEKRD